MPQPTEEKNSPWLVYIDTQTFLYARYQRNKNDVRATAPRLLRPDEVERFRINPQSVIDEGINK